MGAALSTAYADEPPAPAPDNQHMSRHGDNDEQQGQFERYHDARHGVTHDRDGDITSPTSAAIVGICSMTVRTCAPIRMTATRIDAT